MDNLWRIFTGAAARKLAYLLVALAFGSLLSFCGPAKAAVTVTPTTPGSGLTAQYCVTYLGPNGTTDKGARANNLCAGGVSASGYASALTAALLQITAEANASSPGHDYQSGACTYTENAQEVICNATSSTYKNYSTSAPNGQYYEISWGVGTSAFGYCGNGASPSGPGYNLTCTPVAPVCPSGSTVSGTTCVCNGSTVPNSAGNSCVAPSECASTLAKPATGEVSAPMSTKSVPSKVCIGNCGYIPTGDGLAGEAIYTILAGKITYRGKPEWWIGDGTTCQGSPVGSPSTDPATPPTTDPTPPPPGKCKGTVNGVEVIVSCDSTSTTGSSSSPGGTTGSAATTAPSAPGAVPGTTTASEDTTCTGTKCTTTGTKTTNNSDGTTTTQVSTKTEDKGAFCEANPKSPNCADEEPCENDDIVGCMKPGQITATPLQNQTVALSITAQTGFGASTSTCPAARTVSIAGQSFSFSWQPFCDFATAVRPVVIAVAWLLAGLSFLGLARKE